MTTFYKKVGRRYVAVNEYDPELMDSFPQGEHLVSVRPGQESRRHRIDPAFAPMIAAGLYVEDAMTQAIYRAQELRYNDPIPMTARQRQLMEELTWSMNQSDVKWLRRSAAESAQAGLRVLEQEAHRRMRHPAVRKAYEDFLLVVRLCEEQERG